MMPTPEPIPQQVFAQAAVTEPNTIVVFRGRGVNSTTGVLAKHLGFSMTMAERSPDQPGVVKFAAVSASAPTPVVFERVGIAAIDTTEAEKEELRANPAVAAVVTNEFRTIPPIPRMLDVESHTAASGIAGAVTGSLVAIRADKSQYTGRGVLAAVLDTGIDLTHPDFSGRILATKSFVPGVLTVDDGHGHGTHCAGSLAGASAPAAGPRYGVAPDAQLLIAKVLADNGGGYDSWILAGMDWAAEQGATVISVSIGAPRNPGDPVNAAYQAVIDKLALDGVIVIIAAGNDSNRPSYVKPINSPGATPSAVAVAALDANQRVASFSCAQMPNDWAKLSLAAPGVDIWSAWPKSVYRMISGTSMATPHVAGVAVLLFQRTPGASVATIKQELAQMAVPLTDPPADTGSGLVQAP